jgi:phage tail sheath protein FI
LLAWRSGALHGQQQEEALFVKFDRTAITQSDIGAGRPICRIAVATAEPAEFVTVRIQRNTAPA